MYGTKLCWLMVPKILDFLEDFMCEYTVGSVWFLFLDPMIVYDILMLLEILEPNKVWVDKFKTIVGNLYWFSRFK